MPFLTVIALGGGGGWLLFLLAGARGWADPSWPFNQVVGPVPSICAVTLLVELIRVGRSRARSIGTMLTALLRTVVAMVVYSAIYAAALWVYDMAAGNALAHGLIPPVTRRQYDYLRWLGPVVSLLLVAVLLHRRLNAPQPEDGYDRGVLDTLSNVYEGAEKTSDVVGFVMLVAVCAVISVGGLWYVGHWMYQGDIYGLRIGGGLYFALWMVVLILLGVLWNVIGILLARERKPLKSDAHGGARTATVEELRRRGILK